MLALAARRDSTPPAGRRPPPWLRAAEEFLRANFMQAIDLRQVAAASGVHPVHLARVFRQFYGVTPGQYVRALRLDWAAAQLAASAGSPVPSLEGRLQHKGAWEKDLPRWELLCKLGRRQPTQLNRSAPMITQNAGLDEQQVAQWIAEDAVARRYSAFFRPVGLAPSARTR
jgi:AraC-like DNA-binding protein